ncbi:MAG: rod shape-determining protein MreD [Actinobacteria bacterium]|nr:rod shape-determining protein MreD [Actinomycetota bacterium]
MSNTTKVITVFTLICTVLQIAIAPNISIGGITPNFMLLAVVCTALLEGSKKGCILGFVCGLIFDLCGVGPIGGMAFVFTLTGYITGQLARNLLSDGWVVPIIIFAISALFAELLYGILLLTTGYDGSFFRSLFFRILPSTLYDVLFAFLCFPFINRFVSQTKPRIKNIGSLR